MFFLYSLLTGQMKKIPHPQDRKQQERCSRAHKDIFRACLDDGVSFSCVLAVTLIFLLLNTGMSAYAKGIYQQPDDFISQAFQQTPPTARVIQLNDALKNSIESILKHPYQKTRIRYYLHNNRSAWILEEIGKEHYITSGIIINDDGIEDVRILIFRESRGDEIRHSSFTDQFKGINLNEDQQLNKGIDNITGATLSVRAVNKLARMALFLHHHIRAHEIQ